MATLVTQNLTDEDGGAVTFASAAGGGDKFAWTDKTALMIKNDDGSSKTVTVVAAYAAIDGGANGELTRSDIVLPVAAGAVAVIPPLPVPFRNGSDGLVSLTYSAATSLFVAAIRLQ